MRLEYTVGIEAAGQKGNLSNKNGLRSSPWEVLASTNLVSVL